MTERVLGFTGTQIIKDHGAAIGRLLSGVDLYDEYVTGACIGFDAVAGMAMCLRFPTARHRVLIPANDYKVSRWWDQPPFRGASNLLVHQMPAGTDFKDRNQAIADLSTELKYCAAFPEEHGKSRRSGTWQTVRMARKGGIPVDGIVLQEG